MCAGAGGMCVQSGSLVHKGVDADQTVQKGDVAVLAFAGLLAVEQSGDDGAKGVQTADVVADDGTAFGGTAGLLPGDVHHAGHRLGNKVKTGDLAVGPHLAGHGDGAVNNLGVDFRDGLIVQVKFLHSPGGIAFNQYIRVMNHLVNALLRTGVVQG